MAMNKDTDNDYGVTAKSELLTIAEFHSDDKIRDERGMELFEIHKAKGDDSSILELARNHRITYAVRKAAGDFLVDKAIKGNIWTTLAELRDDALLLPEIREHAKAAVDAAAIHWIKEYDEKKEPWNLSAMKQRIEQLPMEARGLLVKTLGRYAAEMEKAFGPKRKECPASRRTCPASGGQQKKLQQGQAASRK